MKPYFRTERTNLIECDADLVILDGSQLVLASLIDLEIRNRKICADFIEGHSTYLCDLEDERFSQFVGAHGMKFSFKSSKLDDTRSHTILKSNLYDKSCIIWNGEVVANKLSDFIQSKLYIPVTPEMVEKLFALKYGSPFHSLEVYTSNPIFEGVRGYTVKKTALLNALSDIDIGVSPTNFDWDSINNTEDYLIRFCDSIKHRLNSNIKVMLGDDVSPIIFDGKRKPYKGQVPIIQSAIEVLKSEKFVYLAMEQGSGKQQPLDARILTPTGWTTMGEAFVGMPIIGRDGKTYKVTGVFPQGKQPAYEVTFKDGTSTQCGLDHLWATKTKSERSTKKSWKIRSLKEILELGLMCTQEPHSWKAVRGYRPTLQFSIPLVSPIEFTEKDLPVDPYFLGALLGDGSLCNNSVALSVPDDKLEVLDKIKSKLSDNLKVVGDNCGVCPRYRFSKKSGKKNLLYEKIKVMGLNVKGDKKFIPEIYKQGSVDQRMDILRGLMDTDGSCDKNRVTFHNKNLQLVNDLSEIVRSLGGVVNLRVSDRTSEGKGIEYSLNVKMNVCPFHLSHKKSNWKPAKGANKLAKFIKEVEYVGDVEQQCISVDSPDNLYVTDDYIVTHNTTVAAKTNNCVVKPEGYSTLVLAPAITLTQWKEELIESIPNDIDIKIIKKTTDFIKEYNPKPTKPTYYLVGKETFKLDSIKKPGVVYKKRTLTRTVTKSYYEKTKIKETIEVATCPDCGIPLQNPLRNDVVFLTRSDFDRPKKSNYRCHKCGGMLWQSTYDKTKKSSLIRYIRTKKIKFDSIIVDEVHQSNNSGSIIGNATRTLMRHGKKIILLSGTTNNGYASSFHNVLMSLKSSQLKDDECLKSEEFVRKYGTLLATINENDPKYKKGGKTHIGDSEFKEIEGVNPILFTKYLSRNYIFSTLDDLGENLPPIIEKYIPVEADSKLAQNEANLRADFRSANPFLSKIYENSIVRHYVNNPSGWSPIIVNSPQGEIPVHPRNMTNPILTKDDKLVEIVQQELSENRKMFIYVDFTGKSGDGQYMSGINIPDRLKAMLKERLGIDAFILKPSVSPINRKELIEKVKDKYDVFITNPILVNVGINMQFCPTYIYYVPSYMVNIVDQSARRGYRVNSTLENRLFHLYYSNTCEAGIMERYQLKRLESKAIESKFDFEVSLANRTASGLSKRINDALIGASV